MEKKQTYFVQVQRIRVIIIIIISPLRLVIYL